MGRCKMPPLSPSSGGPDHANRLTGFSIMEILIVNGLNFCFMLTYFRVAFYIETSHLICTANKATVFYMKCRAGLKYHTLAHFGAN